MKNIILTLLALSIVGIAFHYTIRWYRNRISASIDTFINDLVPDCLNKVSNDNAGSALEALIINHRYNHKYYYVIFVHPQIGSAKLRIDENDYFFKKIDGTWQRSTSELYLV